MEHPPCILPGDILIVAADHPSLASDVDAFLDRVERDHHDARPSTRDPEPFRSSIATLRARGGFCMAAVECGRIVGLARIDGAGELSVAVGPEHRNRGIGTALGRAMLERAHDLHCTRIVIRTTRRSRAVLRIGEQLGAVVVHVGRGRAEIVLDRRPVIRTACGA